MLIVYNNKQTRSLQYNMTECWLCTTTNKLEVCTSSLFVVVDNQHSIMLYCKLLVCCCCCYFCLYCYLFYNHIFSSGCVSVVRMMPGLICFYWFLYSKVAQDILILLFSYLDLTRLEVYSTTWLNVDSVQQQTN
jgi:hypothetical protein